MSGDRYQSAKQILEQELTNGNLGQALDAVFPTIQDIIRFPAVAAANQACRSVLTHQNYAQFAAEILAHVATLEGVQITANDLQVFATAGADVDKAISNAQAAVQAPSNVFNHYAPLETTGAVNNDSLQYHMQIAGERFAEATTNMSIEDKKAFFKVLNNAQRASDVAAGIDAMRARLSTSSSRASLDKLSTYLAGLPIQDNNTTITLPGEFHTEILNHLKRTAAKSLDFSKEDKDAEREVFKGIHKGEKSHRIVQTFGTAEELAQRNGALKRELVDKKHQKSINEAEIKRLEEELKVKKEKSSAEAGVDKSVSTIKIVLAIALFFAVLAALAFVSMGGIALAGGAVGFGSGGGALVALGVLITGGGIVGGLAVAKGALEARKHSNSVSTLENKIKDLQTANVDLERQTTDITNEIEQNEITIQQMERSKQTIRDVENDQMLEIEDRAQLHFLGSRSQLHTIAPALDGKVHEEFIHNLDGRKSENLRNNAATSAKNSSNTFVGKLAADGYEAGISKQQTVADRRAAEASIRSM